jgi:hypothetical protein
MQHWVDHQQRCDRVRRYDLTSGHKTDKTDGEERIDRLTNRHTEIARLMFDVPSRTCTPTHTHIYTQRTRALVRMGLRKWELRARPTVLPCVLHATLGGPSTTLQPRAMV